MRRVTLVVGIVLILAFVILLVSVRIVNTFSNQTISFGLGLVSGTFDAKDLVAFIGAVTGVFSLFLHWYRGRPRLKVEVVGSDHSLVAAANFSGTTLTLGLRIKNTSDTATSVFKVDATTKLGSEEKTQTFPLGLAPSKSFPYVTRGIVILGHEIVEVPLFFNFPGVSFPQKQTCSVQVWHTHGRIRLPFDSTTKT